MNVTVVSLFGPTAPTCSVVGEAVQPAGRLSFTSPGASVPDPERRCSVAANGAPRTL